ncbi:PepSY domain-containing protein [Pseudoalteromonas sp. B131b]
MLQKLSWQKIFRRLHLYLGLSIGFLLTVIALSGSVLIYYPQIDSQLNLTKVNIKHTDKVDWDLAYKNLKTAFPDKYGPWRLEVTDDNSIIPARYYNPVETQNREFATLMIWLSNDKYKVIRKDYWGDYFVTWLYNLHFSLLTGSTGIIIVGYIGIATLILLISGLLAWWPKKVNG